MVRKYRNRIAVYLTDECKAELEAIGDAAGTPLSVTIRKILIDYLNNEGGDENKQSYTKYYWIRIQW